MSKDGDTCPYCGWENEEPQIGLFDLAAGRGEDPLKVDERLCESCDRTYRVTN